MLLDPSPVTNSHLLGPSPPRAWHTLWTVPIKASVYLGEVAKVTTAIPLCMSNLIRLIIYILWLPVGVYSMAHEQLTSTLCGSSNFSGLPLPKISDLITRTATSHMVALLRIT